MAEPRLFDRAVLRLSPLDDGEDVRGFLQGLVTQDLAALGETTPLWAGLLSPQGKALFDFLLWDAGVAVLMDAEAAALPALAKRLALYRLRRRIAIEPEPGLGVFWMLPDDSARGLPDPRLPALGRRWLAPIAANDQDAAAAWRAHRLGLGVAEGIGELGSDQTLWLECNADALNGVSFAKGCYVGQENTARMNWRHKVNRRLAVVPIAESTSARQRVAYPELGLAVDHRPVETLADMPLPDWQRAAIGAVHSDSAQPEGGAGA